MINLEQLKERGLVPHDSRVISEHNNTIIESAAERLIGRVATLSSIESRDTPGDIRYAHALAWEMRNKGAVVAPVTERPIVEDGVVVSLYPKLNQAVWTSLKAPALHRKMSIFSNSLDVLSEDMSHELYVLDISEYATRRLDGVKNEKQECDEGLIELVGNNLDYYTQSYPFPELTADDGALVHGDLHANNIVATDAGEPRIIDLDSVSTGPRLYDLASWHIRSLRGDAAPTVEMIELEKRMGNWKEESFKALMGWKVLSSLTHELKYQQDGMMRRSGISQLTSIATRTSLPGRWRL